LITVFFIGLSHAYAAEHDIQSLYNICKMPPTSPEFAICVGYISGVGDTLQFMSVDKHRDPDVQPFAICGTPSYGAMIQAFVNWTEKHPKEWTRDRITGAMLALGENWPYKSN
jgi:hypothetical protein